MVRLTMYMSSGIHELRPCPSFSRHWPTMPGKMTRAAERFEIRRVQRGPFLVKRPDMVNL